MPQLNLASEVTRAQLVARRRRALYAVTVVLILVLLAGWGIPFFLTNNVRTRIAAVEGEITRLDTQLGAKRDEVRPIVLFMRRLELLKERLNAHEGWSRVLAEFERLLPTEAHFQTLAGSVESGVLSVHVGVPSVDAAADVVASLQKVAGVNETPFRRVQVVDLTNPEGVVGGRYVLSLKIAVPSDLFRLDLKQPEPAATVPPAPAPAPAR